MFTPQGFVDIGDSLRAGKVEAPGERRFRTTISRAYYGVYLTVREHIRKARSEGAYDIGHSALADWLAAHDDKVVRRFGEELKQLCRSRTDSDYKLAKAIQESHERIAIASAHSLIARAPTTLSRIKSVSFPPSKR